MSAAFDLEPAAQRLAQVLRGVRDDQLADPSPCEHYSVGDLVEHAGGLALGFTWAATKQWPGGSSQAPSGDAARLDDDWRTLYPQRLAELGQAWRDPAAWQGMTEAGGVPLPAEVAACVAMDELVVHGWDIARATGQPYDVPDDEVAVAHGFVAASQGQPEPPPGLFAAPVDVMGEASSLDRLVALTGRDPAWVPPGS
ncbi:TIGR03086 family metal-binding protein [Angustibacter peucedani]